MKFCKTEVLKILGIAILSAILFNSFSSTGLAYFYKPLQLEKKRIINLEETKRIFDEKTALFIDARPVLFYKRGHIPGAMSVPFNSDEKDSLMKDIPKDRNIVVYCYSARCNQASILDVRIRKMGYTNVALFEGGISEWSKAKYPVEKTEEASAVKSGKK